MVVAAEDLGGWLVQPMPDGVHVIPEREATKHELDCGCSCMPEIEAWDPRTDRPHDVIVVIHRRISCVGL